MDFLRRRGEVDPKVVSMLEETLGYRREVCEALVLRGVDTDDKAQAFLHPFLQNLTPWENYTGMAEVKERLETAIEFNEKVVIYGDYDCDGVCATAILYLMLQGQGVEVDFYLPNRKREGYGINREALEDIAEKCCPDLIITVDCGITAVEEIAYAQEVLGLEIIVTDHHEPKDELPDCLIVNPKAPRKDDCFNELCGAGIALRLCEAIGGIGAMMMYVDIAAIATIADIVPLISDNRIIVNYGLEIINARARQSIKLLVEISCDDPTQTLTSTDVAFKLVPRLNAIGRLSDSSKAVRLFIDDDYFYAKSIAQQADATNKERRALTDELVRACMTKLEDYDLESNRVIVLKDKGWEGGVLGIAAAKIAEIFKRPTILLTFSDGVYKGSGRSIEGVNLYEALRATGSYLASYGGHSMACGIAIDEENVDNFIMAFNEFMQMSPIGMFLPSIIYDIEMPLSEMNVKLIEDMSILEPFGAGNPQVSYLTAADGIVFDNVGKTKHIKSNINEEFELIAFDTAEKMPLLNAATTISVVYSSANQVYKNRKYAQGILQDWDAKYDADMKGGEYYAVKHLYQKRYSDKSFFQPKTVSENEIERFLNNGIYGTCFLCYNKNTFKEFKLKYGDKLIYSSPGNCEELNPYNSLVLDVDISEKLMYFKRIVFLDAPIAKGLADMLKLNKDCEIYIAITADRGYAENKQLVAREFPSVQRMREIFVNMRGILEKNETSKGVQLLNLMRKLGVKVGVIEFYIAFFALFELGIIKSNGKLFIDGKVKTSLDNSKIYSGIQEEIDGLFIAKS